MTDEDIDNCIEIQTYANGKLVATTHAETAEGALLAARTTWDEAYTGVQGCKRSVAFYTPYPRKLISQLDRRP